MTRAIICRLILLHPVFALIPLSAEVGSQACEACHPAIVKSYRATAMARSSGRLEGAEVWERLSSADVHVTSGRARVLREGGQLAFTIEDGDHRIQRSLDYFIGSGLVGRSYLSSIDGFLFQAPVSYYSSQHRWDISPGFETQNHLSLTRAVETGCLRCHASRLQPIAGTVNGYRSPPFMEAGVSCERCHGSGEAHIAAKRSLKSGDGPAIVNPAKLDNAQRDAICAQCHLSGVVEIAKKDANPFQPGKLLSDSSTVFVWNDPGGEYKANSHFERMAQSACWRASGGKFWCGTCHSAHTRPAESEKVAFYRSRCLTCHTDQSCAEKQPARTAAKDNCIQCHMPRTKIRTVRHAASTEHSIPRRPKPWIPGRSSAASLVPFEGEADDRELGLAYADVALRDNNRLWGMKAFELLRKTYEAHPEDLKVATQMSQLYDRLGNQSKACEIYAAIVSADATAVAPAVNLGTCLARQGQMLRAIELWEGALKRNPGLESARTNLAVALAGTGDVDKAKSTLREGLKFDPLSHRLQAILQQFE